LIVVTLIFAEVVESMIGVFELVADVLGSWRDRREQRRARR